jgi:hypothetical protein
MRLFDGSVNVGEVALIGVAAEGLGMLALPVGDFGRVHPDLALLHPGAKLPQGFLVVVFADARADAIIPIVQRALKN